MGDFARTNMADSLSIYICISSFDISQQQFHPTADLLFKPRRDEAGTKHKKTHLPVKYFLEGTVLLSVGPLALSNSHCHGHG